MPSQGFVILNKEAQKAREGQERGSVLQTDKNRGNLCRDSLKRAETEPAVAFLALLAAALH